MYTDEKKLVGKWTILFEGHEIGYIDFDSYELFSFKNNETEHLSRAPMCVLKKLVANSNSVISKERLYESYTEVENAQSIDGNVKQTISTLRKANGNLLRDLINSETRIGYRFKGEIHKIKDMSMEESSSYIEEVDRDNSLDEDETPIGLEDIDFSRILQRKKPNIFLTTKEDTESEKYYPFHKRMYKISIPFLLHRVPSIIPTSARICL